MKQDVAFMGQLRTFARNFSNIDFFLKLLPLKYVELAMSVACVAWRFFLTIWGRWESGKATIRSAKAVRSLGERQLRQATQATMSEVWNNRRVTDFVLERTCPEEHLNLSKSGFVSEEDHSGCKSQNIAIRALKGRVLCPIWLNGPVKQI